MFSLCFLQFEIEKEAVFRCVVAATVSYITVPAMLHHQLLSTSISQSRVCGRGPATHIFPVGCILLAPDWWDRRHGRHEVLES